jgi:hypothetical protein
VNSKRRRPIRGRYIAFGEEKDKTNGNPTQILSYAENTMTPFISHTFGHLFQNLFLKVIQCSCFLFHFGKVDAFINI